MKFRIFLTLMLAAIICYGGTVNGTVTYTGSASGSILVIVIEEGASSFDPLGTPFTTITGPGPYSVDHSSLTDGTNYFALSVMGSGMIPMPETGAPAGMTPESFSLSGGSVSGVDIALEEEGNVAGTITYAGDASTICIDLYDVYPEFTGGTATLENTYCVGVNDYTITDVPSGAKRLVAYSDNNGNETLDAGEESATFDGPMGDMIFVGGGGLSESDMDVTIPYTGICENSRPEDLQVNIFPNPFNSSCRIEAPEDATIEIFDIQGNRVDCLENGNIWFPGEDVESGLYLAKIVVGERNLSRKITYLK